MKLCAHWQNVMRRNRGTQMLKVKAYAQSQHDDNNQGIIPAASTSFQESTISSPRLETKLHKPHFYNSKYPFIFIFRIFLVVSVEIMCLLCKHKKDSIQKNKNTITLL